MKELEQVIQDHKGKSLDFQNSEGIWFTSDQVHRVLTTPREPTVFSDYRDKDLAWHMNECQDLITFCELFGLKFQTIGIQGTVPYLELVAEDGSYLGKLHQFTTYSVNQDQFIFSFDPSPLGITDTRYLSGAGWMYKL